MNYYVIFLLFFYWLKTFPTGCEYNVVESRKIRWCGDIYYVLSRKSFCPPKNHKGNWCHYTFCACWVYPNCQISNNDNFHCITWISVPLMEIEDRKYWKVATKQLLALVLVLIRNNGGGASNEPLIKSPQALCSQGTGGPLPWHFDLQTSSW